MNERPCFRCQHPVLLEDGHLVYCSHCGAPQIFLSEELQSELAEGVRAFQERTTVPPPEPAEPSSEVAAIPGRRWNPLRPRSAAREQPWSLAVQYALLSAGVALALGLLSLLLPPFSLLMLLWLVIAPIATVGLFTARSQASPVAPSAFAARLGLLTGVLLVFCCAVIFTLSLVLTRFVFHNAAVLDAQLAASFAQQRTAVLQRLGSGVQPTLDLFALPEYRVGVLLSVTATSAAFYLFLSTVSAAVAGLVFGRRPSA